MSTKKTYTVKVTEPISITEASTLLDKDEKLGIDQLVSIQAAIVKMEKIAAKLRGQLTHKMEGLKFKDFQIHYGFSEDTLQVEVPCTGRNLEMVTLVFKEKSRTVWEVTNLPQISQSDKLLEQALADGVVQKVEFVKSDMPKIKVLEAQGKLPTYLSVSKTTTTKLGCIESMSATVQPNPTEDNK